MRRIGWRERVMVMLKSSLKVKIQVDGWVGLGLMDGDAGTKYARMGD
jgi:hypothetical protein